MHLTAALLFASLLPQAPVKEIKGRIVDADNKPVAGVPIAAFWTVKKDAWTPGGPLLATSDAEGAFAKKVLWGNEPTPYFAITEDGARGGIVLLDDKNVDEAHDIQLAPMARVEATFDFTECGAVVPLLVSLIVPPSRLFIGQLQSSSEKLQLLLPPGEYAVRTHSHDAEQFDRSFTVPAGAREVDLGALLIQPSVIARHYGKEPPAIGVTDARGVGADFQLAQLKGKWVLLDFWGHW